MRQAGCLCVCRLVNNSGTPLPSPPPAPCWVCKQIQTGSQLSSCRSLNAPHPVAQGLLAAHRMRWLFLNTIIIILTLEL